MYVYIESLMQSYCFKTSSSNNKQAIALEEQVRPQDDLDDVIDGVVVSNDKRVRRTLESMTLFFTIIAVVVTVLLVNSRHSSTNISSLQPPLSPSISLSPTKAFTYYSFTREIAAQVSTKELLLGSSTIQFKTWQYLATRLPLIVNTGHIQLNDTKRITLRFIVGLVQYNLIIEKYMVNVPELPDAFDTVNFNECALGPYSRNDKDELTPFVLTDSIARGGGFLVTEIGKPPELRHLSIARCGTAGTIPSEVGDLKHLRTLDLSDKFLVREIPTEIDQLDNLLVAWGYSFGNGKLEKNAVFECFWKLIERIYSDRDRIFE